MSKWRGLRARQGHLGDVHAAGRLEAVVGHRVGHMLQFFPQLVFRSAFLRYAPAQLESVVQAEPASQPPQTPSTASAFPHSRNP